jgi:hypothetical protein
LPRDQFGRRLSLGLGADQCSAQKHDRKNRASNRSETRRKNRPRGATVIPLHQLICPQRPMPRKLNGESVTSFRGNMPQRHT